MRTRNALERLSAAGSPLLLRADALVDAVEEEQILGRIVATPRGARRRSHVRPALAVVLAASGAAAIAVVATRGAGPRPVALTGAGIEAAGYHFRTPAGFAASSSSCTANTEPDVQGGPNRFGAAASAAGGCVEAFFLISMSGSDLPSDVTPVAVGAYQGYYAPADVSGESKLYVVLPTPAGADVKWQALVLDAQELTEDQLVAVAESGLPATPSSTVG